MLRPRPMPGIPPKTLLAHLEALVSNGDVARGVSHVWTEHRTSFLRWFLDSRRTVSPIVQPASLDVLLPMRTAWRVADSLPAMELSVGQLFSLIDAEFEAVMGELSDAAQTVRASIENVDSTPGHLVVVDTSVLIAHQDKLREQVLAKDLLLRDSPVRIVLPMVVVDELDALKDSKDAHVRWRAGHSLGVLDELLRDGRGPTRLRQRSWTTDEDPTPRGEVYVEILHDPDQHVRLPINDDEIIDRACSLQELAGNRSLTFATFDTGQAMRARAAQLHVHKLNRQEHADNR